MHLVSTPKFEKQYSEMMKNYQAVFDELKLKSSKPKSEDFKEVQRKALRAIHLNENALCSKTESTHYSNFSVNLADKFWEKIRANYPEIDYSTD
jgi:hypothetical protein